MKRLAIGVIAALVLAAATLQGAGWYTEGEKTNPANGTVLAEFVSETTQNITWSILADTTVAVKLIVEVIDAEEAVVKSQRISVAPNDTKPIGNGYITYTIGEGHTLRVKVNQALTVGMVQASLFVQ